MYFNLDELPVKILKRKRDYYRTQMVFFYDGKIYYYKGLMTYEYYYNELIAEKIANQAGIPCAHYYLGCYGGEDGIVSESIDLKYYYSMKDFLEIHNKYSRKWRNTFENIWQTLEKEFDDETTTKLMDNLVDIFLFDAIIGNPDRNLGNYGLNISKDNVEFAPLYDNELMTYDKTIQEGFYDLRVDGVSERQNMLYYFLDISDKKYQERLLNMLPLISEENIRKIFRELSFEGISIPIDEKLHILKKLAINRKMIEDYFKEKQKTYQMTK